MKKYAIVVPAVDWKHGYFFIIFNTIGLLDSVVDWSLDLDEADNIYLVHVNERSCNKVKDEIPVVQPGIVV
ncbi:hypothetical protein [Pedobacter sp. B4-66]|uniref:hypothetical protein n=1 Tax=Pedobacter sp. B4-66 TaxID=2817280 RepID=UPI001BD99706|nr:hypothetical protein [Pedobacter sp. B4-66]